MKIHLYLLLTEFAFSLTVDSEPEALRCLKRFIKFVQTENNLTKIAPKTSWWAAKKYLATKSHMENVMTLSEQIGMGDNEVAAALIRSS